MTLDISEKRKLYAELSEGLTEHKKALFKTKVAQRTRHFSLGLEDMMKTQNASALMRTADAFGIHRVDVYDKNERFNVASGISKGVEKWLDTAFFNTSPLKLLNAFLPKPTLFPYFCNGKTTCCAK